jgi:hypothetical protein
MRFTLQQLPGYLRADLVGRETADETREFIAALNEEVRRHAIKRVMVVVRDSRPIFRVEQYQMSGVLKEIAANRDSRIALVGDGDGVRASHEYIQVLARQQQANVRSFADEASAAGWLAES